MSGWPPIKVALVDDSGVARRLTRAALEQDPTIRVVWEAGNGREALERLAACAPAERPDLLVLDLEMPELDGLATLERLRVAQRRLPVLVLSALTHRGARATLEALARGALDYVCKPRASESGALEAFRGELLRKVRACARPIAIPSRITADHQPRDGEKPLATAAPAQSTARCLTRPTGSERCGLRWESGSPRPELIGIAASTGGPQALVVVLKGLSGPLPVPVLITQHMPPGFTAALAEHLARVTGHPCSEARDRETPEAGHVYIAPGGFHLLVRGPGARELRLSDAPPRHHCRPAADPMFESMAEAVGARSLAIVLTGLGSDGAAGAHRIAAAGGRVIAQDEATSVVWGMPGATVRCGAAELVLPLDRIGPTVAALVGIR